MQAIVLTAGLARRMQPLSLEHHKALLPVGDTTILGRIMDALVNISVNRITVVTGYKASDIEETLLSDYPNLNFQFVRNNRFEETNNIVSLALALEVIELDDDIILLECDLLFDPIILKQLVAHPAENVALVDLWRTGMDGTVVKLKNGWVDTVLTASSQHSEFSYRKKYKTLNIYKFSAVFCRSTLLPMLKFYAESLDEHSYYEVVLGMLAGLPKYRIAGLKIDSRTWTEVDDPNDLEVARFHFDPEERAGILDKAFGGHWNFDILDFSFMSNVHFPTGAMLAAMRHALPELISSYGSAQEILNQKLGIFLFCRPDRLEVLHGASQVLPILAHIFEGMTVSIPSPTFGEYSSRFPNARQYSDHHHLGINIHELQNVTRECDVVVIVNPNSPTGSTLPTTLIVDLAENNPQTTFIVDESFLAFTDENSIVEVLEDKRLDNILVIASLSKTLGIPGLRLGYIYSSNARLLGDVRTQIPVWNLSSITEYFLELVIKFRADLSDSILMTKQDRGEFANALGKIVAIDHVHAGGGNFIMACLSDNFPMTAAEIRGELLNLEKIEVKDVTTKFSDGKSRLRIAVRSHGDNIRLVQALTSLVERRSQRDIGA